MPLLVTGTSPALLGIVVRTLGSTVCPVLLCDGLCSDKKTGGERDGEGGTVEKERKREG